MLKGHGGNIFDLARNIGCESSDITDMSSNVNPLGPPDGLVECLHDSLESITALPEVDADEITTAFSAKYGLSAEHVLAGNGTTQFIYSIPQALESKQALILGPTYADYEDACRMHNVRYSFLMAKESQKFCPDLNQVDKNIKNCDTVFICNPNNPTGVLIPGDRLESVARFHPDTNFVIDESYLPFVVGGEKESLINRQLANVIVLNSMSKIFRIPGLRIGFYISSTKLVKKMKHFATPWSVNSLGQAAVKFLMERQVQADEFVKKTRSFLKTEMDKFCQAIQKASELKPFPGATPFVLIKLPDGIRSDAVCEKLAQNRILIRNCANFAGLSDDIIRISLNKHNTNIRLAEQLISIVRSPEKILAANK